MWPSAADFRVKPIGLKARRLISRWPDNEITIADCEGLLSDHPLNSQPHSKSFTEASTICILIKKKEKSVEWLRGRICLSLELQICFTCKKNSLAKEKLLDLIFTQRCFLLVFQTFQQKTFGRLGRG